jgi:ferrous iron transport protein B
VHPSDSRQRFEIDYGDEIESAIGELEGVITPWSEIAEAYEPRWLALKLLEGEVDIVDRVAGLEGGDSLMKVVGELTTRLARSAPDGLEVAIANQRYAFVNQVTGKVLTKPSAPPITISERIDRVATNRWLGVPIFLLVMYLVFNLVVNVSAPYLTWIDRVINGVFTRWAGFLLDLFGSPMWLKGLILDGAIPGVGGVLVFVPGLFVLFLFIGLLEDSGYMARGAVVMNRFMRVLGLHGKSFVPLILGFGCAVPAIYATRTLDSRRDRLLTTLLVPLMSCSARLPVYVVFGMAFFGRKADLVIWSLYALGILVASVVGLIFSRTIFRSGGDAAFVLELPPYHMPTLKNLWFQVSQRVREFILKAGTIILAASLVIWLLLSLPFGVSDLNQSWLGQVSTVLAPIFKPAGFGNWETTSSLVTGLLAKEVVVSTMSQIYLGGEAVEESRPASTFVEDLAGIGSSFIAASVEAGKELVEVLTPGVAVFGVEAEATKDIELSQALQAAHTPMSALAFLVFVLLYVPCVATLGAIRGEFGLKWAIFSAVWQTSVAWLLAVLVFQIGRLLGYA